MTKPAIQSEAILKCLEAADSACPLALNTSISGCSLTNVSNCTWIQTPAVWGLDPSSDHNEVKKRIAEGTSLLIEEFERILCTANKSIDIASLEPLPDGNFLDILEKSLISLDGKRRQIFIRLLFGAHVATNENQATLYAFVKRLTRNLKESSLLRIKACRMVSNDSGINSSWNHSKLLVVDDKFVLTGGHNLWSDDYFGITPVHDLSALLQGECVNQATHFLNEMWGWVESKKSSGRPFLCHGFIYDGFSIKKLISESNSKNTSILSHRLSPKCNALALSRFGSGLGDEFDLVDSHTRFAILAAFGQAKSSLFISNMDLAFRYRDFTAWDDQLFECWCDLLTAVDRSVSIKIVLSQPNNKTYYSWNIQPDEVMKKMHEHIGSRSVTGSLCVSTIQYSDSGNYWRGYDGIQTVANHSKTWIIDNHLFYIGSDNLYPHRLQEFGYLIDSRSLAANLIETYWNPLWRYSMRNMLSL
jgi:phosphatidylserine/phosphatidylglycerophosphate/cardiolipin synthase-like enzyme